MQRIPSLYVAKSRVAGRGVFTSENLPEGCLLEICPVIVIPEEEVHIIHQTVLHDYYYFWGDEEKEAAIILGFGSVYNHSFQPNAECIPDHDRRTFDYYTLRPIAAGEEITVNYHGDGGAEDDLWFGYKE
jgi:SET domain-containing protein